MEIWVLKYIFVSLESGKSLSWDKKLEKEDLDGTLELLNNYDKIYNDIKTTFDCILYSTSSGWRAVIDITEKVCIVVNQNIRYISA